MEFFQLPLIPHDMAAYEKGHSEACLGSSPRNYRSEVSVMERQGGMEVHMMHICDAHSAPHVLKSQRL